MKLKSSPLLVAIGIVYTVIVTGFHYSSTDDVKEDKHIYIQTDLIFSSESNITSREDLLIEKQVMVPVPEVTIPEKVSKRIPEDLDKRCPEFENVFKQFGLPPKLFSYIAWRESRCRIKAINARFNSRGEVVWTLNKDGSIDRGLLQINSTWKTVTKNVCGTDIHGLMDIKCNLSVAKYLYENGGAGHWGF
jgi:hypothetical protein